MNSLVWSARALSIFNSFWLSVLNLVSPRRLAIQTWRNSQLTSLLSMSVCDILKNRRTIRNYDPDYVIPKEQLTKIMDAVRLSPTAFGVQDLDFLVCTNKKKNQEAADATVANLDENIQKQLLERAEKFKVTNVVTCDASAEVLVWKASNVSGDAGLELLSRPDTEQSRSIHRA